MAFRTFTDSSGLEWEAFDVIPRHSERRTFDRRSSTTDPAADADRRETERRYTVDVQLPLSARLRNGWLVFERGSERESERRRLAPIPDDWEQCGDAELESYLRLAQPVDQKKSAAVIPRR